MALFDELQRVCPRGKAIILQGVVAALPDLDTRFHIHTGLRLEHFLAQCAHESDGFHTMEEYASGAAYEGRHDLGNTHPGDGIRYKGRGPFQLTGRANYRSYGRALGLDLEGDPELAANPHTGMLIAGQYWVDHNLNSEADADMLTGITRAINGGLNGFADRKMYLDKFKQLGI
jgi:putative chitinase